MVPTTPLSEQLDPRFVTANHSIAMEAIAAHDMDNLRNVVGQMTGTLLNAHPQVVEMEAQLVNVGLQRHPAGSIAAETDDQHITFRRTPKGKQVSRIMAEQFERDYAKRRDFPF